MKKSVRAARPPGGDDRTRYGPGRRLVNLTLLALPWLAWAGSRTLPARAQSRPRTLLALGDSLTAGYGLIQRDGFTAQLERALAARGMTVKVINAGVSGDTSAGGLARVDWALADRPDAVLVELGANDGLRGLDPLHTRANLDAVIRKVKAKGVPLLLAGMRAPPNLGREYVAAFDAIYPSLAAEHQVALYPFFLDGVAAEPKLNQADGIHPNAAGVAVIVERILPQVIGLLERAG